MIQFNLLPDIKQQFIKAKRTQGLVTTIAFIVGAGCIAILVLLFLVVDVLQKAHLDAVNKDITKYTNQLNSNTDLPKILTVQNQLKSLPKLFAQRPVVSRLFDDLSKIIPQGVNVASFAIDYGQHTMSFTGNANSLDTVNQFVDTLKFTTYTTPNNSTPVKAFNSVVLGSFGRADKGSANYIISLSYDPAIFDSSQVPQLNVPNITSTRSSTDEPIFKDLPKTTTQTNQVP